MKEDQISGVTEAVATHLRNSRAGEARLLVFPRLLRVCVRPTLGSRLLVVCWGSHSDGLNDNPPGYLHPRSLNQH